MSEQNQSNQSEGEQETMHETVPITPEQSGEALLDSVGISKSESEGVKENEESSEQGGEQIIIHTMPKQFVGAKESRRKETQGTLAQPPQKTMGNKRFLIILIALVFLLIGGGIVAYVAFKRPAPAEPPGVEITPPPPPPPPPPAQPEEGGQNETGEPNEEETNTGEGGEEVNQPPKTNQTVLLLGEDLIQRVVQSYDDAGNKTTESVLSLERESEVNYSKITITEHVVEKKPEYFAYVAGQSYEVRLREESPGAKAVLSITFEKTLLDKLNLIPADVRIGYLSFPRLEENIYRSARFEIRGLTIATNGDDTNGIPVSDITSGDTAQIPSSSATGETDGRSISDTSIGDIPQGALPSKGISDVTDAPSQPPGVSSAEPVVIWEILKAQDLDDDIYSVSSVLDGVKEGIYAVVPLNVNELIVNDLPPPPAPEPPDEETQGEVVVGADSDKDLLTDKEELLYGTSPIVADSDLDAFGDGGEVLTLYSPARGKGVALSDDTQFTFYEHAKDAAYSVLHSKSFSPRPLIAEENKDIIFVGPNNESILISIQENKEQLDVKAWILSLSSGISASALQEFTTKGGYSAIAIENKTAYYVHVPKVPFIFVFSYTSPDEYNYLTTFKMMVESFAYKGDTGV